jgi:hypothetical protein
MYAETTTVNFSLRPNMPVTIQGYRIPLDVVDCIAEEIANADGTSSLRSCALVCRDFTDICQKRIFAEVTLFNTDDSNVDPSQSLMTRFDKLLQLKAGIADYVGTLRYIYDAHHNPAHSAILRSLRSVETFSFSNSVDSPS